MTVEFALLGDVRAWHGGRDVDLGTPGQRAMLALLLLAEGRLLCVEELIDRMWGADPPPSARVTTRTYISRLRRSLAEAAGADAVIESTAGGYCLPGVADRLDLKVFQRRTEAARAGENPAAARMHASETARHEDRSMSTRAREPRPGTHEQLIAALLPDVTPQRPTPRAVSMPSLSAPSLPSLEDPNTLLVGTARVDRSGRVHERTLLRALSWEPGQGTDARRDRQHDRHHTRTRQPAPRRRPRSAAPLYSGGSWTYRARR